jgi:hypothetical protein
MGRNWWACLVLVAACRGAAGQAYPIDDGTPLSSAAPGGGDAKPLGEGQAGGAPTRGAADEVGAGESASAAVGGAGDGEVAEGCGAERVTLDEIHSGRVRDSVAVAVGPLVASSQKFLVSEAKSGSCLWGAFASGSGRSGLGSGLFLVSYGPPHAEGEACTAGADGLPDDLQPGDSLEVEGRLDEYATAACDATAPAPQLRIDAVCPARRGAPTDPPEAAVIEPELANRLAAGKDAQLLRAWSGALVRLEHVAAVQDGDDGDAVFPFGVIRLEQTALEVHSRLYYFDLSAGGPRDAGKAPRYRFPTAFGSVTGVLFLDYCTWVLAPRDRCADVSPPSEGCTGLVARP